MPIVTRQGGSVPAAGAVRAITGQFFDFMTSRQAKLQEDTSFRVMRILEENPDLTQRELAEQLGISVGGLNYCLKALMEKGLVKMKNFANSKNKFGYVYVLTPIGMAEKVAITHRFLQRKMSEYEALKLEIEALKSEVKRATVRPVTARQTPPRNSSSVS
jgi:EPS-associated MarR family transcriptional regulator